MTQPVLDLRSASQPMSVGRWLVAGDQYDKDGNFLSNPAFGVPFTLDIVQNAFSIVAAAVVPVPSASRPLFTRMRVKRLECRIFDATQPVSEDLTLALPVFNLASSATSTQFGSGTVSGTFTSTQHGTVALAGNWTFPVTAGLLGLTPLTNSTVNLSIPASTVTLAGGPIMSAGIATFTAQNQVDIGTGALAAELPPFVGTFQNQSFQTPVGSPIQFNTDPTTVALHVPAVAVTGTATGPNYIGGVLTAMVVTASATISGASFITPVSLGVSGLVFQDSTSGTLTPASSGSGVLSVSDVGPVVLAITVYKSSQVGDLPLVATVRDFLNDQRVRAMDYLSTLVDVYIQPSGNTPFTGKQWVVNLPHEVELASGELLMVTVSIEANGASVKVIPFIRTFVEDMSC